MAGKHIVEVSKPQTQLIASGKALAMFLGLKEEMPKIIPLANGSQLTLSSKSDCYYYTSLDGCSCPSGVNHKRCWHRHDLTQATREATKEPMLACMIKAAKDNAGSKLELFGNKPFKPVLE
ncbi:MAG: hypothetical protein WB392_15170 [Methanotrichaceae archaeon]